MARAMGADRPDSFPSFRAMGNMPMIVARETHENSAQPDAARCDHRFFYGQILLFQLVSQIDDQNAVGTQDAN